MIRLYLDNNATSPIHPRVRAAFTDALQVSGNASSIHGEGRLARHRLEEAREIVATLLSASPREIVFTSGGSESNNTALLGTAFQLGQRSHIVTTSIEHPSVIETTRWLERRGHEVSFVDPDPTGRVVPDNVLAAVRDDTKIVAVMLANNETGVIQPVREIAAACHDRGLLVHCDAVQAVGRVKIDPYELGVDTLSVAAHKMHGPKGIGALWVRSGLVLEPLISGGAQERRRRAGTESVPLAVGFAAAARLALDEAGKINEIETWRNEIEAELLASVEGSFVNGYGAERLPNTTNLCFRGHDAEGIVIAADLEGMAISTGSACSSGRVEPSHVLLRMGVSEEDARSSIRISLGRMNTVEEVRRATELLQTVIPRNRKHREGTAVSTRGAVDSSA